jgi:hypothetical protein
VGLVAVEVTVSGLAAVSGVGVHGRDDPVPPNPAADAEPAIICGLRVLAGHDGQQLRRLGHLPGELGTLEHLHHRVRVSHQLVHQRLPRGGVVSVDGWLADLLVVVPGHGPFHLHLPWGVGSGQQPEQAPHGPPDERNGVLGLDRGQERGGVEHPGSPLGQQPRLGGHLLEPLEDPPEPLPEVAQHGGVEPLVLKRQLQGDLPADVAAYLSVVSRSLMPSSDRSRSTLASRDGGTECLPLEASYRSEKSASVNSRPPTSASFRWIEPSATKWPHTASASSRSVCDEAVPSISALREENDVGVILSEDDARRWG